MKMRTFKQEKLWRDKLPDKMVKMGSVIHIKQLDDGEYDHQLRVKFIEEAEEVKVAKSRKELMEELADVLEVIDSLCALHNLSRSEIEMVQEKKRAERGGFLERKFVTIAEHPEGSFGEHYCLAQPEKYPEIV